MLTSPSMSPSSFFMGTSGAVKPAADSPPPLPPEPPLLSSPHAVTPARARTHAPAHVDHLRNVICSPPSVGALPLPTPGRSGAPRVAGPSSAGPSPHAGPTRGPAS